MTKDKGAIYIGTSGWCYNHWKGPFYPQNLPNHQKLPYYCRHFHTVEVNNAFYRLPEKQTLRRWREAAPPGFVYTAKASRTITHMKKLKDSKGHVRLFLDRIGLLEEKLGPILFQLPPRWHFNAERLEAFLGVLDGSFHYVFEFRDPSWLNEDTYALLSRDNAAFCIYDLNGFLSPKKIIADFIYVRLHGPETAYQGCYDEPALSGWVGDFSTWASEGKTVYCYFDNDEAAYAAKNAARLQRMLIENKERLGAGFPEA
ncbi:MAG: DUF72 domain-containing protein [Nitrospiria bacterium]